jgi:PAS domain S-box-containing protein
VRYFNERWLEFTGRRLEEELGWGWADRVHPDERAAVMAEYEAAFAERRRFDLEYRLRRADGEYRWVLDTATPRFGGDGAFLGYVGCRTDVTDRRALEHRLKQMERTDAIAQLAGGIATTSTILLTGIIGHCSLLLEDPSLSLEARGDLAQIQRSADRAAGLTRQLLAFSRRQILAPRILELNRVVTGAVSALRGVVGNRIDVLQVLAPDLPPVMAIPARSSRSCSARHPRAGSDARRQPTRSAHGGGAGDEAFAAQREARPRRLRHSRSATPAGDGAVPCSTCSTPSPASRWVTGRASWRRYGIVKQAALRRGEHGRGGPGSRSTPRQEMAGTARGVPPRGRGGGPAGPRRYCWWRASRSASWRGRC